MKWAIINSLPLTSSKDPSMKVWIQLFSPSLISNFLHVLFSKNKFLWNLTNLIELNYPTSEGS